MNGQGPMTRRGFLKTTGAAAVAASMLTAKSWARSVGANDKLNMAVIGCGGIAGHHLDRLLPMLDEEKLNILAVCDVYETRAKGFRDRIKGVGGDPKVLTDHNDVLAMKDIDYVLIATPEHAHHPVTMAALDAGKHVYVEKPIAHSIPQALDIVAKAKKTGLTVQVGVQGMSDDSYATAAEAIKAGKIGPVVEAQIDYVRWYPANCGPWRDAGLDPKMPKPADLNWEAWLGSAPRHQWESWRYFNWRNYRDYSGGIGTDLFVHRTSRLVRALGLTFPTRVVGMGGIYLWPDGRELPDNFEMLAEYPAVEGVSPGLTLHVLGTMANDKGNSHCIRGQAGSLIFTDSGWKIVPHDKPDDQPIETFKKTGAEDVGLHHKNHHAVIRGQAKELNCPPELGLFGFLPVAMANESWFTKKMINWDSAASKMVPA